MAIRFKGTLAVVEVDPNGNTTTTYTNVPIDAATGSAVKQQLVDRTQADSNTAAAAANTAGQIAAAAAS